MKILIELLSDAAVGSGEGLAGLIDREAQFDRFGLPYLPAKRIKGILREAAKDYQEAATGTTDENTLSRLFGERGRGFTHGMRLSNGYLDHYDELRQTFRQLDEDCLAVMSPELVRICYAYVRAQTSINRESKTAQDDTLRTTRVLKKGLRFQFDVSFNGQPTNDDLVLLDRACRLSRHFGLNRTRGMGEIRTSLEHDREQREKVAETVLIAPETSEASLAYSLRLNSQMIACASVGGNFVSTDPFISGAKVLGAFAGAFLRQRHLGGKAHEDDSFRRCFLSGATCFENAYPADPSEKVRLLPVPASLVYSRDGGDLFDLAFADDLETIIEKDVSVRGLAHPFCIIQESDLSLLSPLTEVEYHHQRPEQDRSIGHATESQGEFFQFEVLGSGQLFKGLIRGREVDLAALRILIPDRSPLWLGKSRTAQYGEAVIEYGPIESVSISRNDEDELPDAFVITLTSPMILCNREGHITPDPQLFVDLLTRNIFADDKRQPSDSGDKSADDRTTYTNDIALAKEGGAFLKFIDIGGFMSHWGLPLPQCRALDAGSVLIIENGSGKPICPGDIERQAYGLRTEQGFGRVKVDIHGNRGIKEVPFEFQAILPERFPPAFAALVRDVLSNRLRDDMRAKAIDVSRTVVKRIASRRILTNALLYRLGKVFEVPLNSGVFLQRFQTLNKSIAENHMKDFSLEIAPFRDTQPLNYWLKTLLEDNGSKFRENLIIQCKSLQESTIRDMCRRAGIIDNWPDSMLVDEMLAIFFTALFQLFQLHNRGTHHD